MSTFPEIVKKIDEVIWSAGYHLTHSHEDLVFFTHNHFLFQLHGPEKPIEVFLNREVGEERKGPLFDELTRVLGKAGLRLVRAGSYELVATPDEQLEINFYRPVEEPSTH